jgi:CHAT domain-containing protein
MQPPSPLSAKPLHNPTQSFTLMAMLPTLQFCNPKNSVLALDDTDKLTVQDLIQFPLDSYSLITLTSCETALSGHQTITTEYVGITSAFLSQGIPHILSTL